MTDFYGNPDYWKNWSERNNRWTDGRWLAKKK